MKNARPALAAIAALFLTPNLVSAQDIEWTIAPYLWASDVTLDVTIENDPVLGGTVPFRDLVDKLEGAFMLHGEVSGQRFGALLGFITISLADSSSRQLIVGSINTDVDLDLDFLELAGFYRFGEMAAGSAAFDILLGARLVDVVTRMDFQITGGPVDILAERDIDVSETDWMIGGRVMGKWNDRWGYRVRADVAGGGTDGTVNALATINYTFGQTGLFTLDGGYRYMNLELEDTLNVNLASESDIVFSGPLIGFIFNF